MVLSVSNVPATDPLGPLFTSWLPPRPTPWGSPRSLLQKNPASKTIAAHEPDCLLSLFLHPNFWSLLERVTLPTSLIYESMVTSTNWVFSSSSFSNSHQWLFLNSALPASHPSTPYQIASPSPLRERKSHPTAAPQTSHQEVFNLHSLLPRWDLGAAEWRACSSSYSPLHPSSSGMGRGAAKLCVEGWEYFPQWRWSPDGETGAPGAGNSLHGGMGLAHLEIFPACLAPSVPRACGQLCPRSGMLFLPMPPHPRTSPPHCDTAPQTPWNPRVLLPRVWLGLACGPVSREEGLGGCGGWQL